MACGPCDIAGIVGGKVAVDVRNTELVEVLKHRLINELLVERLPHAQINIAVGSFRRLTYQDLPEVLEPQVRVIERPELVTRTRLADRRKRIIGSRVDVQVATN